MKKLIPLFTFFTFILLNAQTRYLEEVFEEIEVEENIIYGENYSFLQYLAFGITANQQLEMDIYKPVGDDLAERPVVMVVHTGSFLPIFLNNTTTGERNDSATVEICKQLARRGFVVANIDYRLGWNPISESKDVRVNTLINAAYRGVQDGRTCVRYLKKSVAENGNPYGIDSARITVFGQGTGGYGAYAMATLDSPTEFELDKFLFINPDGVLTTHVTEDVNGSLEGFGYPDPEQENGFIETDTASLFFGQFIPLNKPNHIGYNSDFQFGFATGGALPAAAWIDENSIPCAAVQTVTDPSAPFYTEILIVPTTLEDVVEVDGAGTSMPVFNESGVNDVLLKDEAGDDFILTDDYSSSLREKTYSVTGLDGQENIWAITSQDAVSSPWEWWDPNNSNHDFQGPSGFFDENGVELTFHEYNLLFNPDMSKQKALVYIDTILNFFAPRAALALDLLPLSELQHTTIVGLETLSPIDFEISPNPATAFVQITAKTERLQNIKIYDIQGKLLKEYAINDTQYLLKREDLNNGIYILQIETTNGIYSQKLIWE